MPPKKSKADSTAERDDWRETVESAIDGVKRNLCRSAPERIRLELEVFRTRSAAIQGKAERKRFERQLDSYSESSACLRAATKRYVAMNSRKCW